MWIAQKSPDFTLRKQSPCPKKLGTVFIVPLYVNGGDCLQKLHALFTLEALTAVFRVIQWTTTKLRICFDFVCTQSQKHYNKARTLLKKILVKHS